MLTRPASRMRTISIVAFAALCPDIAIAQPVSFQGLGLFPGLDRSSAGRISANGRAIAGTSFSWTSAQYSQGYIWRAETGWLGIGLPPQGQAGDIFALSADGKAAPGFSHLAPSSWTYGFRWTEAGGFQLMPGLPTSLSMISIDISADGSTVVGLASSGWIGGQSYYHATRWTQSGGTQDLGTLIGPAAFSYANAVNADGSVIVGKSHGGSGAFRWTAAGGMQEVGGLPGSTFTSAEAVSADGSVVAGWSGGALVTRPFRWTSAGRTQDLGGLPGFEFMVTSAMSGDGSAIVGSAMLTSAPYTSLAFLWTVPTGVVDLNDYLPTLGIDLTGWELTSATGADADARTIAGVGKHEWAPGQIRYESWVVRFDRMCTADCNADWKLSVADFGCFQSNYVRGDPYADCTGDSVLTIADFGCFQALYVAGCP
ncbi:MAG: hypothetical protein ACKVU4_15395 [Phycisphaerales bacterium]